MLKSEFTAGTKIRGTKSEEVFTVIQKPDGSLYLINCLGGYECSLEVRKPGVRLYRGLAGQMLSQTFMFSQFEKVG